MSWPPDPPEPDILEIQCMNCFGLGHEVVWEVPAACTGLDEDGNPEWEVDIEEAACPRCGEEDCDWSTT